GEVARRAGRAEVERKLVETDDVLRARGAVDDRVEVDKGIVPRRVHVARVRLLGVVLRVDRGVPAGLRLGRRVADVLHVPLPREATRGQLVGERAHALGVHAARADGLTVARRRGEAEVAVDLAVALRLRVRALTAQLGDVVGQAVVRGAVVIVEELPLREQRLVEIRRGRRRAERLRVVLVLEVDDERVAHDRRLPRRRG